MNKATAIRIAYSSASVANVSPKDVVKYASNMGCDMTLEEASEALGVLWVTDMCDLRDGLYHNSRYDYLLNREGEWVS
jgi:hypothetical protein